MQSDFATALGNYEEVISNLFQSDNVVEVFDFLDNLTLPSGNGRGKESVLKEAIRVEKEERLKVQKETEKLESEIKSYEVKHAGLLKEKKTIQAATEIKLNEKIPCEEDEDTLNKNRANLKLYKDLTGIRWDYSAPDNLAKGYVYGAVKNYVHSFNIPLDDNSVDKLWQEIENASLKPSTVSKGKENVMVKKAKSK